MSSIHKLRHRKIHLRTTALRRNTCSIYHRDEQAIPCPWIIHSPDAQCMCLVENLKTMFTHCFLGHVGQISAVSHINIARSAQRGESKFRGEERFQCSEKLQVACWLMSLANVLQGLLRAGSGVECAVHAHSIIITA